MRALLGLLTGALVLLVAQNLLLNFAVPLLLNGRPERLQVDYTVAWMLVPGQVTVRNLELRVQGVADQWHLAVDEASGDIRLHDLLERRFHAGDVRTRGVSFWHRRRLDAPPPQGQDEPNPQEQPAPEGEETDYSAPIPGLNNPPDPNPDLIYPKRDTPWLIRLDDLIATDIREVWLGDYHLSGTADLAADISIADPYVDLMGAVSIVNMRADIGDIAVAQDIVGDMHVLIDCMDKRGLGSARLEAITVRARAGADIADLRFLDFYLAPVPWLKLSGVGHVDIDMGLELGTFSQNSNFTAVFPELLVRILQNDVAGSGTIFAEVGLDALGEPQTQIAVDFDEFWITPDGDSRPLVEGTGFHIDAVSPDVALDQPFTAVSVVVELPESRIPNVEIYNVYLPTAIGLSLLDGSGTARGGLVASSLDSSASGELFLAGDEIKVQFDAFRFTGDVSLHAVLTHAQLDTGVYDLSGTTVDLRQVGLIDQQNAHENDGQRDWSASLKVVSGLIQVEAPVYLDTSLQVRCSDSVPFVRLFTESKSLPGWAQRGLSVPALTGAARLKLGQNTLALAPARVRSGDYQLDLRYYRTGQHSTGELLVAAGPLSVGVALRANGPELQLFGAKRWFDR